MISRLQAMSDMLRRLTRRWKLLTLRKLLYLPHVLSGREKRALLFLVNIMLISSIGLGVRAYFFFTHPVPQIGGSYSEGLIGVPRAINPLYPAKDAERDLARLIFSGLLTYNGAGELEPDLAERYEVSDDGKIYDIFLRSNLYWHDGRQLDADDVVFTIKRVQDPQYKSPLRPNWQGVEVEKVDSRTLRFTLRAPYAPFIENLTQAIIPRHLWEKVSAEQALLHELNLSPVGSGPYQLRRFEAQGDGSLLSYTLSRNPSYHRDGPYLKEITLFFFASEDEMVAAWRRGEIDGFAPISAASVETLNHERVSVHTLSTPRIFSLFFNPHESPILAEKNARTAIAHALDTTRIAADAPAGGGITISSLLPSFRLASTGEISRYAYDPEQSRTLLKQAGWKDEDGDGILEKKIRQDRKTQIMPLRLTLSTSNWPELSRASALIKNDLSAVGIEVTIQEKTLAELESSVIRPRAFELLLFGQVYGYEPDPFAFWHSSQAKDPGLNVALFTNKKADKVLEEARSITDAAGRSEKYQEFARLAAEELPAIPLYTQLYLYLLPRNLQGVAVQKISLPADRFNDVNLWYRKTERSFR